MLKAELYRLIIMIKRYPMNSISTIFAFYLLFGGLLLSSSLMNGADAEISAKPEGLISFLMWFYSLMALGNLSESIREEAGVGTLENIYISVKKPIVLYGIRLLWAFIIQTFMCLIIIFLTTITYNVSIPNLTFNFLPILFLTLTGLFGFGLVLAGLTLVYKKIGELVNILKYFFLVFTLIKWEEYDSLFASIGRFFPMVEGTSLLRQLGSNIDYSISISSYSILLIQAAFYLIFGIFIFLRFEKKAKNNASLSHY